MPSLLPDIRFAARTLLRSPLFAATAVVSLALGIGANSAVFSLLDQVLLRPLPVKNPRELVMLNWSGAAVGNSGGLNSLPYPFYKDIAANQPAFNGVLCRYLAPLSIGYQGQAERVYGELVSGNYFDVLGVGPAIGRVITSADDTAPGANPVAVLSYNYWRERFASDPSVVGRTILISGTQFTIIGVSQAGFDGLEFGLSAKIRVPVTMKTQAVPGFWSRAYTLESRVDRWVNVFARLKPEISREQAQASIQPMFQAMIDENLRLQPPSNPYVAQQARRAVLELIPGSRGNSRVRDRFAAPLWVLTVLVGFVLLITCANVAGLMAARAAARQKEMAVRLAVGANRWQIVRQLLVESVILSLLGGLGGLALATGSVKMLVVRLPYSSEPVNLSTVPDWRVLVFTLGVSMLSGIVFGLAPALQSVRVALATTLKEQAGAVVGGGVGLRKVLVAAQVFLSIVLLTGSSLFLRSLHNLRESDPGFRTANLITFSLDPPLSGYSSAQSFLFYRQLRDRLNALPGAESASLGVMRILGDIEWLSMVSVENHEVKPGENMTPQFNAITAGYFSTLHIPLAAGREFNEADETGTRKIGIVNERFAKRFFGASENALGRHFGFRGAKDIEIVGIIRDVKYSNLREQVREQVFVPFTQVESALAMTAYVRTREKPDSAFSAVRQTVRDMGTNMPVYLMRTLEEQVDQTLSGERIVAFLAGVFGALAALLAAVGLYGVMAFTVTRRTREIGIMMALGAGTARVIWIVVREIVILSAAGILLALPATYLLSRLIRNQLFGVQPADPASMGAAVAGILFIGVLASLAPAVRAMRIDPIRALRQE